MERHLIPFISSRERCPILLGLPWRSYDAPPEEWPEAALEPFKDVVNDPVAWAKKCVQSYGAELIALQLVSTDPNGLNRSER